MNRPETTRPSENSGSVAQARFLYQHHYIAYWCVQMLVNSQIECIVCEHHEDFYIRWKDGHYDFFQVKTRAEGEGEWSLADLTRKTGKSRDQSSESGLSILQKLYNQKLKFGESLPNHYCFVSNMGAGEPRTPNLKTFKNLLERKHEWEEQDSETFNTIFETIKSKMGDCDEATLRDFCLSFDIQTWQPNSNAEIRRRNYGELENALYRTQGIHFEPDNIKNIYELILNVVREANTVEEDASLDRSVEKKTIYPHHIRECIAYSPAIPDYLERVEIPSDEFDEKDQQELTTLQEKTQKALWDPDAITYLMDLRASAKNFYKKWHVFNQARKRLEHLSLKVQRACIGVKADAHDGSEQWKLLEKRLEELVEKDSKEGHKPVVDVDYLFGVVGDLTGKCKNRWA